MTTDVNPNPSDGAATFPPRTSEVPTRPASVGTDDENGADKTADRMAHKAAKTEQNFDKDNSQLFNK
jgi:hypothetical protein